MEQLDGATVLVLHHTGWNAERERGSIALRAAADLVYRIEVTRRGKAANLTTVKASNCENPAPLALDWRKDSLPSGKETLVLDRAVFRAVNSDGGSFSVARLLHVLLHHFAMNEGATHAQWLRAAEGDDWKERTFFKYKKDCIEGGYVKSPEGGGNAKKYTITTEGLAIVRQNYCT
jgi:hypothetical protein